MSDHQPPFDGPRALASYTDEQLRSLIKDSNIIHAECDAETREILMALLIEFRDCLALSVMDLTSPANFPPIRLLGVESNKELRPPYKSRFAERERKAVEDQVRLWLEAGIVERVQGWPVVLNNLMCAPKNGGKSYRICIDPRPLNAVTVADIYSTGGFCDDDRSA